MSLVSNTGLLASIQNLPYRKRNNEEHQYLSFSNITGPAPYALRPFSGLYNPFPYGCSILCNHPADCEVKDIVKKAKDAWGNDCKTTLQEEIAALRATALNKHADDGDEIVPEELFRRYTETDSRPLTPAPTLASVMTHSSNVNKGGRRCFTPDPLPSHGRHTSERPLLVLDLRRTQSQDTISWHGGPGGPVPTTVLQPPTRSPTPNSTSAGAGTRRSKKSTSPSKKSAASDAKANDDSNSDGNKLEQQVMKTLPAPSADGGVDSNEAEEIQRRRGRQRKKNKKHSRDLSSGVEKEFKGLPEPGETQEHQYLTFSKITGPAPYALRPFSGLYNPFPYGCSILCNHPADCEVKDIVKKAKDAWGNDCKTTLQEEIAALRATALNKHADDGDEIVPEELFRRYTETDSRPLTPAPTLASVMTHSSNVNKGGRRCFTPDPLPSHGRHTSERPLLVLDLRRTQSQDTISWHGGPGGPVPTTVLQPPTRSPTPNSTSAGAGTRRSKKSTSPSKKSAASDAKANDDSNSDGNKLEQQVMKTLPAPSADGGVDSNEAEEIQRRRGRQRKKNKKHSRDLSSGVEKEFKGLPEPGETQVSAFGNESRVGSARQSLTVQGADGQMTPHSRASMSARGSHGAASLQPSFVDHHVLKLLSRELDREVIDNEFDVMRRIALEEAYRVFPPNSHLGQSEEVTKVKKELRLPPTDIELWLSLPRTFSRQSARFELPLDREVFNKMTPLEYIRQHVSITSGRRMLYNLVFNRHRENADMEVEDRRISGEKIIAALGEMMGRPMTEEESNKFQNLVGWTDADLLDFRVWCGLCALCERIMGPSFSSQVVSQEIDARHEVEKADFDTLPRRLLSLKPDPRLLTILMQIRDC
ncbi:uncharacterized protein LOC111049495 [Nilaparvata lugens]|uniref:uncharacterized protein LOC111049495 n=1 Tax=Nilaparvata lugens TaxID=108931 RepID=UPI00193E70C2|nr:uncharacterized protein LOC111049495 [Nilaparvata lugens]